MTASPETETRTGAEAAPVPAGGQPVPVSAQALRLALGAVMPHAGTDDELPALKAVKLEIRSGVLYAVATDRYTMAVAKVPVTELTEPALSADALMSLSWTEQLLRKLDGVSGAVLLGVSEHQVTADTCDGRAATWSTVAGNPEWPDWRKLLHAWLSAPAAELGGKFGLVASQLAKLDLSGEPLRYASSEALAFRWTGTHRPMALVTRGDWFIAVICPARISDSSVTDPADAWAGWTALTAPEAVSAGV